MKRKILHSAILIFGLCLLGSKSSECGKIDSACNMENASSTGQAVHTEWISEEYMLIHDLFFKTL